MDSELVFKEEINNATYGLEGMKNPPLYLTDDYRCELEKLEGLKQIRWIVDTEQIVNYLPSDINKIYTNVVNEIIKLQGFNFFIQSDDFLQIKKLVEEFKKENPQPIDYDRYWFAFNQIYFFKNLYKAFVTIDYLYSRGLIVSKTDLPVIDVGCGAGVCTIAWRILFGECTCEIILIDRNKFQLESARQITKIFRGNKFEFYNASFPDEFDQLHGIRLFSYYFCEQEDYGALFDASNLSKIVGEGALIIDYKYIIDRLQNITNSKFKFIRWTIKVEKIPQILAEKNQKEQYIYGAYIRP